MLVAAPLDETFAFFSDASNLQRLAPPWLRFSIRTALPIVMRAGTELEYRIRLYGLPIRWVTRIDLWEPTVRFVDSQLAGPLLFWRHQHRFESVGDGTRVIDDVEYVPHAAWMTRRFVQRDVERIFRYRHEALRQIFGANNSSFD